MDSQSPFENIFNIQIDNNAKSFLLTAVKWAKVTAIIGFVSAGLSILTLVFGIQKTGGQFAGFLAGTSMLVMIPVLAVSIILNIFLLRFANSTAHGLESVSQGSFNQGIGQLRFYFKTLGILIIIIISLAILFIIIFMIGLGLR
jgi:hypothetical protein